MTGKLEKSKGKLEVAVGAITGNKDLESKGKIDRQAGVAKEKIGRVASEVEKIAQKTERKAVNAIDKTKKVTHRK